MISSNSVTIWTEGKPVFFSGVFARLTDGIEKNGIKQKGFFENKTCILRIPTQTPLKIAVGNYVRFGKHTDDYDRNSDFRIMKINANLCGSTPHYKVVCER